MSATSLFAQLSLQPPDSLLKLIGDYAADPRSGKIDLGVGVYRDPEGRTPVLKAVKEAEQRLLAGQASKSYLGPEGNVAFNQELTRMFLGGRDHGAMCVQTPGGTGALRLAMDVIARAKPHARVWVGNPTWPNHFALLAAAGLEVSNYRQFDQQAQKLCFDETAAALNRAEPGDVVLLHGCCHNPTGADFSQEQWSEVADIITKRLLLPLIDLAYQGLGEDFDSDGKGARLVIERCDEALLAYSCDKNFALYRERTGALFAFTRSDAVRETVLSNILSSARSNWSMPPDHGAAIVQTILEDDKLTALWRSELKTMRERVCGIRKQMAAAHPDFMPVSSQKGLFSLLPVKPAGATWLKETCGIYMPVSGRINVAGLTENNLPQFIKAWSMLKKDHGEFLLNAK